MSNTFFSNRSAETITLATRFRKEVRPIQVVALQDHCTTKKIGRLDFVKIRSGFMSRAPKKVRIERPEMRMDELPKIIWMLWLQGWDHAPRLLQACRRTWEINNPDWTIYYLDRRTVIPFIDDSVVRAVVDDPDRSPQVCAERIRIALLEQHAGVWADATRGAGQYLC
jgi:hypothetical protein